MAEVDVEVDVSAAQLEEAIHPETATAEEMTVGNKRVSIRPLTRRWQALFAQAALQLFRPELSATESIQKAVDDGQVDFVSLNSLIIDSELESDKHLDRAAAIVLASQIAGSEKNADKTIQEQMEWIQDNTTADQLRALVEAQTAKERLIESVGKRLAARFARSLQLAGNDVTSDTVQRHLTSLWQKLQDQAGAGK